MSTNPSAARDAAETAQKRAQWEQFAFDVEAPGLVEVTNESHETLADYQYTVSIDDVTDDLRPVPARITFTATLSIDTGRVLRKASRSESLVTVAAPVLLSRHGAVYPSISPLFAFPD
ncbi:hypothetical protein [Haladaptatus salinisoli]|uniref:hypothetical protein n=1 Tax=Haladaptatus salinisoli TaxID=2884876 RepID=UPI001D0A8FCF|nr:hypothetical protein [Haladaptatus salinisoli]